MSKILILFLKTPRPGFVKTRLTSIFSQSEAAELYSSFIKDTLHLALNITGVSVYVAWTPDDGLPELQSVLGCNAKVSWFKQKGNHLGEKLSNALKGFLEKKTQKIVILAGDSPLLPQNYVEQAFSTLDKNEIVIGPAIDGGYYLIGMSSKAIDKYKTVFELIDWGTSRVLDQTRKAIRSCSLSYHELPTWYDVDYPEDLEKIRNDIKLLRKDGDYKTGSNTEATIKAIFERRS